MEVYVYGKSQKRSLVQEHLSINRPKIWIDATGIVFLKAKHIEVELTTQDINRLSRASERAGAALEA